MRGCPCCEGREPDKQPDMTIEEIEEGLGYQTSEEYQETQKKWLESRPPTVRAVAEKFLAPLYRVKEGNPYNYTPAGSIVTLYKIVEKGCKNGHIEAEPWFHVLRNPAGYAHLVTPFDEEWLEPITLDELKEIVRKEETN